MTQPGMFITFTGKRFAPLEPDVELIDPFDIAHALSNLCRYTGHTRFFYSVAQHSVLMHDYAVLQGYSQRTCCELLMHDAPETYLLDLAAPLKHHPNGFGNAFIEAEDRIERAIAKRFNLSYPHNPIIKKIDLSIRETEMNRLMHPGVERHHWDDPLPVRIEYWDSFRAEAEMLKRMRLYPDVLVHMQHESLAFA